MSFLGDSDNSIMSVGIALLGHAEVREAFSDPAPRFPILSHEITHLSEPTERAPSNPLPSLHLARMVLRRA